MAEIDSNSVSNRIFMDLLASEYPELVMIGSEGPDRERFIPAIVGIDYNAGRLIYSRPKLVECYVKSDGMTHEEAEEWIDYNVDRGLGYMGVHAPILMNPID